MSYKFSTGSVRRGDIYFEDDDTGSQTYIDFGQDTITLRPSGSAVLYAQHNMVGIGTTSPDYTLDVAGNIGVDQYIRHNDNANTHINFTEDKINLKAGNKSMVTMEEKGSAPHEVTINDGSNNIDFVVKGNGSNAGNPLLMCDASTGRVGINGVGSPDCELHVAGDVGIDEKLIHNGDADTYIAFSGQNTINLVANGYSFLKYDGAIKINNANRDRDTQIMADNGNVVLHVDAGTNRVGINTDSPLVALDVNGGLRVQSDSIAVSNSKTPSSASDTGQAGQICWDTNYLYVCVSSNTWKRIALSSW